MVACMVGGGGGGGQNSNDELFKVGGLFRVSKRGPLFGKLAMHGSGTLHQDSFRQFPCFILMLMASEARWLL